MATQTFNPYSLVGNQLAKGMDSIAKSLTIDSTIDDLAKAIYDYIQPLYYPSATTQIEIEVKSVVYNIANAYNNKILGNMLLYGEQQMKFIQMMLGRITTNKTPVNAIDSWLLDIEDNISKFGLSLDEQTPLLLGIESGKSIYAYWIIQNENPEKWKKFFQASLPLNYINIPFWTVACMNGALIGANASQKGLIAPTTDITSVNIISSLIGALTIGAGKVIFKWVPEIQPTELTNGNNGMLFGGFSEAIDAGGDFSLVLNKKDNKCRTNPGTCANVLCTNNCVNTGTCTGAN